MFVAASDTLSVTVATPDPQVCEVVGEVTCTVYEPDGARSAGPHDKIPFAIVQFDGPLATDQLIPAAVGSVSKSVAELAAVAPVFSAVTVNPIVEPAAIPVESGVSVSPSLGAEGDEV